MALFERGNPKRFDSLAGHIPLTYLSRETINNRRRSTSFIESLEKVFKDPKGLLTRQFNRVLIGQDLDSARTQNSLPALKALEEKLATAVSYNGLSQRGAMDYDNLQRAEGQLHLYNSSDAPNRQFFHQDLTGSDPLTQIAIINNSPAPLAYIEKDGKVVEVFITGISGSSEDYVSKVRTLYQSMSNISPRVTFSLLIPASASIESAASIAAGSFSNDRNINLRAIVLPYPVERISAVVDSITGNAIPDAWYSTQPEIAPISLPVRRVSAIATTEKGSSGKVLKIDEVFQKERELKKNTKEGEAIRNVISQFESFLHPILLVYMTRLNGRIENRDFGKYNKNDYYKLREAIVNLRKGIKFFMGNPQDYNIEKLFIKGKEFKKFRIEELQAKGKSGLSGLECLVQENFAGSEFPFLQVISYKDERGFAMYMSRQYGNIVGVGCLSSSDPVGQFYGAGSIKLRADEFFNLGTALENLYSILP